MDMLRVTRLVRAEIGAMAVAAVSAVAAVAAGNHGLGRAATNDTAASAPIVEAEDEFA
jgi:hypothetical protein